MKWLEVIFHSICNNVSEKWMSIKIWKYYGWNKEHVKRYKLIYHVMAHIFIRQIYIFIIRIWPTHMSEIPVEQFLLQLY